MGGAIFVLLLPLTVGARSVWLHADLSGMSLDGANCEGINLFGARLVRTSFSRCNLRNAELSFSDATGGNFRGVNLDGYLMYRSETKVGHFDGADSLLFREIAAGKGPVGKALSPRGGKRQCGVWASSGVSCSSPDS